MDSSKRWEQKNRRSGGIKKGRTATSRRCRRASKKRGRRYGLRLVEE